MIKGIGLEMKVQVELNILSDDELKNKWSSYLTGIDLEFNQNTLQDHDGLSSLF